MKFQMLMKTEMLKNKNFLHVVFIMLINIKMTTIVGILTFMSMINFMFSRPGRRSAVGNMSGYRCESDANPGVQSSIPARSHTFVEIDHEIISTVILLPSAESFKKGCCHLQAKVCAQRTG